MTDSRTSCGGSPWGATTTSPSRSAWRSSSCGPGPSCAGCTRSTDDSGLAALRDLVLDEDRHEVTRAGRPIELTPTEFKLLHYLLLNTDRVVSKAQILDRVWQYDFDGNENVVEIFVSSLRRKLEAHGPRLIQTVRGVGYRLRPPPERAGRDPPGPPAARAGRGGGRRPAHLRRGRLHPAPVVPRGAGRPRAACRGLPGVAGARLQRGAVGALRPARLLGPPPARPARSPPPAGPAPSPAARATASSRQGPSASWWARAGRWRASRWPSSTAARPRSPRRCPGPCPRDRGRRRSSSTPRARAAPASPTGCWPARSGPTGSAWWWPSP